MPAQSRTIVVLGSGPGIGLSTASKFASEGFDHVILLSRNERRLAHDRRAVTAAAKGAAVRVDTIQADLSDQASLRNALQQVDKLTQTVEVVFFNAARVGPSPLLQFPVESIEADFRTTTIALYTVAQWAMPKLLALRNSSPQAKPSLLVMSGLLHEQPVPDLFSLSLVKTAQRNLVQSLHSVYNPLGVHVALVLVGGAVSPENAVLNPRAIADQTWQLYGQEQPSWELEIAMREPGQ